MMRNRAQGCDSSSIEADEGVKSISHEVTFSTDLEDRADIEAAVRTLAAKVGRRMRRKQLKGRTVFLRMRYDDRTTRSSQTRLPVRATTICISPRACALSSTIFGDRG